MIPPAVCLLYGSARSKIAGSNGSTNFDHLVEERGSALWVVEERESALYVALLRAHPRNKNTCRQFGSLGQFNVSWLRRSYRRHFSTQQCIYAKFSLKQLVLGSRYPDALYLARKLALTCPLIAAETVLISSRETRNVIVKIVRKVLEWDILNCIPQRGEGLLRRP